MDKSPFARLPGEVRNAIWRAALVEPEAVDITHTNPTISANLGKPFMPPALPALLATCRAFRKEAADIFFSENAFVVHGIDRDYCKLLEKLDRRHLDMIPRLQIRECFKNPDGDEKRLEAEFEDLVDMRGDCDMCMDRLDGWACTLVKDLVALGISLDVVEILPPTKGLWGSAQADWRLFTGFYEAARDVEKFGVDGAPAVDNGI